MPSIRPRVFDGALPSGEKLRRTVLNHLSSCDHAIWLSDVYPGSGKWTTAEEAKAAARRWVGAEERFHPHVALHDFEAWLIPYWDRVMKLAGTNRSVPGGYPETINHDNPPSYRIKEAYQVGTCRKNYKKPIDAPKILQGQDLMLAINACPELKALVNTILSLAGGETIA